MIGFLKRLVGRTGGTSTPYLPISVYKLDPARIEDEYTSVLALGSPGETVRSTVRVPGRFWGSWSYEAQITRPPCESIDLSESPGEVKLSFWPYNHSVKFTSVFRERQRYIVKELVLTGFLWINGEQQGTWSTIEQVAVPARRPD